DKNMGQYLEYYPNGSVKASSTCQDGVLSGYYVEYHPNGKMRSQGWFKDDLRHGEWRDYYINGTLQSINYFHKGKFHGDQKYFGVSGKPSYTTTRNYGDIIKEIFYKDSGELLEVIDYHSEKSVYVLSSQHFNGKINSNTSYLNGIKHGPYEYFYFEGSKGITGNYLNGEEHGASVRYRTNGQLTSTVPSSGRKLLAVLHIFSEDCRIHNQFFFPVRYPTGSWVAHYQYAEKEIVSEYLHRKNH